MRENEVNIEFLSKSENEAFARAAVAAFASQADPTIEEIADIKTAVSEAVTNCIVHGYSEKKGNVYIKCTLKDNLLTVVVKDNGKGISDIKEAMQPMFTTNPDDERSGMGFTVMETFMDSVLVESILGVGTKITMEKTIGKDKL